MLRATSASILLLLALSAGAQTPAQRAPQAPAAKPQKELRAPDVIFVPTPHEVVDAMLKVAKVGKDDVLYDLGSGDGRIPITAAQKYGIARGIG
ncbi:MAG TPA: SAM-dependent methyltransferase, partial [Burkholderiales bacterium]|nr:SAM-dependent methyltransferase [Burkholderiales bacterium]